MKPHDLKYILILCIAFLSISVSAQKELKNRIVDFENLLPLENANIYIQNSTIGTISNADGKFVLQVPKKHENDTLIISSIGFKSFKTPINEFDGSLEIFLESDVATLDEVVLIADPRPTTANEILLKALSKLPDNLPSQPYIQKGFLRHKERNAKEFKWLIESAITLYDDSTYVTNTEDNLKINVDEVRKSYDLRNVDSLFTYTSYLKSKLNKRNLRARNLRRDTIETKSLVKAIKWNDTRVNGLQNLFAGKLNLIRNTNKSKALLDESVLDRLQFRLDTVLVDDERKIYKIEISKSREFIDLNLKDIYSKGFEAKGWIYIYWDNYAIKQVEYELIAASDAQKTRSKRLLGTLVNHKVVIKYKEYQDKMYPNYMYYETPKLVNVGFKSKEKMTDEEIEKFNKEERYYYTVQEILFSEIILDEETINQKLNSTWDPDIFSIKPYNKAFWRNYNTLLESEEDEKLIQDLTKRSSLFVKD